MKKREREIIQEAIDIIQGGEGEGDYHKGMAMLKRLIDPLWRDPTDLRTINYRDVAGETELKYPKPLAILAEGKKENDVPPFLFGRKYAR
jgi:hypothetical protein